MQRKIQILISPSVFGTQVSHFPICVCTSTKANTDTVNHECTLKKKQTNFKFLFVHSKTLQTCASGGILINVCISRCLTGKTHQHVLQPQKQTHQNIAHSKYAKIYLVISASSIYIWFIIKHTELVSHEGMIILKSTSFLKINKKVEVATQFQNEQGCVLKPHSVSDLTEMEILFSQQMKFYHVLLKKTQTSTTVEAMVSIHDLQLSHLQVYALHAQDSTMNVTWIWVLKPNKIIPGSDPNMTLTIVTSFNTATLNKMYSCPYHTC